MKGVMPVARQIAAIVRFRNHLHALQGSAKMRILRRPGRPCGRNSVVECQLPKLDVAGSNPVSRSMFSMIYELLTLPRLPHLSGKA
jgi:hypothetical protein